MLTEKCRKILRAAFILQILVMPVPVLICYFYRAKNLFHFKIWHFVVHAGNLLVACAHNILCFWSSEVYSKAISYVYISDFSHWAVYNEKLNLIEACFVYIDAFLHFIKGSKLYKGRCY